MTNFSEIYNGDLPWLEKGTIFVTLAGSRAYGTSRPDSDTDYRGIAIAPKSHLYSYQHNFEQAVQSNPTDLVIYSLQKLMKLAEGSNPNIIELLYTDRESWVLSTPVFEKLVENRHLFLSTKARHTFAGYAISQLRRIKSHRNWLLNPPSHEPTRTEFGLSDGHKVSKSVMGAFDNIEERHGAKFDAKIMELLTAEKRYAAALANYGQYVGWKKNRNASRHALEAVNGYDTKHGMHLVRLMRMCKEILSAGEVIVNRPDAKELLEIRNGAWSYDELIDWAESIDKEIEELYVSGKSCLPRKADSKALDALCVELIEMHYGNSL